MSPATATEKISSQLRFVGSEPCPNQTETLNSLQQFCCWFKLQLLFSFCILHLELLFPSYKIGNSVSKLYSFPHFSILESTARSALSFATSTRVSGKNATWLHLQADRFLWTRSWTAENSHLFINNNTSWVSGPLLHLDFSSYVPYIPKFSRICQPGPSFSEGAFLPWYFTD